MPAQDSIKSQRIREKKRWNRKSRAPIRAKRASRAIVIPKQRYQSLDETTAGRQLGNSRKMKIQSTFSFLEDPDGALKTLEELTEILGNKKVEFVEIDHRHCRHMDLCASVVLDTAIVKARERARRLLQPLNLKGRLSTKSDSVNAMLCAAGLPHTLKVEKTELPPELRATFRVFEKQEGTASHPDSSRKRDICSTKLTEYFDGCLRTQGVTLTDDGNYNLACLLSEIIGNAEEHGGPWHAIGYWDGAKFQTAKGTAGELHIVIFNDGRTIYEAMNAPDSSPNIVQALQRLSQNHREEFADSKGGWNEEALWTLYSVQDQVSRFTGIPKGKSRGNGTIKMIDFFNSLAAPERKKMCILSGNTYILLDGTYSLQTNHQGLKQIAFNKANDLSKRPDPKYVRSLKGRFAGTLVSIRLVLDAQFLQALVGPQEESVKSWQS
jgi:hypothetical protein